MKKEGRKLRNIISSPSPFRLLHKPWKIILFFWAAILLVSNYCFSSIQQRGFECNVDFVNKSLNFNFGLQDYGITGITGSINSLGEYNFNVSLRHFKLGATDILTDFQATGIRDKESKVIRGKAWTQRTLLDLKPISEVNAEYEIAGDVLKLSNLCWADIKVTGELELKPSGNVDLDIVLDNIELNKLAGLLGIDQRQVRLAGLVCGKINIKGPMDALKVRGELSAKQGTVADIDFKSLKVNIEGNYPILSLLDSQINDVRGIVYTLEGEFNAKELSNFRSPEHKVIVKTSNDTMPFQDWVIKRKSDNRGKDMVEAVYSLQKNHVLKMRIKDSEETLAWEKVVKF